ncbi:hypothetical protein [Alteromonas sp. a30]|uniref:hypothetical protein n=1 Tax=Alteromonas sp. a30 TaxID=2730917 RepID=UPI00227F5F16|nr:hypothetical protein [Alteromonas sp. a30]MCY7297410.1 hypothetical protein [Alteromonas sp. a30]
MLKHIKSVCAVLLALSFVSPAQASDDWLNQLFPWLSSLTGSVETQGVGFGFGDPRTQEKETIYVANGVGFGFGHPPNSDNAVTTSGVGFGGGDPVSTQD